MGSHRTSPSHSSQRNGLAYPPPLFSLSPILVPPLISVYHGAALLSSLPKPSLAQCLPRVLVMPNGTVPLPSLFGTCGH